MVELPKPRPRRIERLPAPNFYEHSSEADYGWAVSYADVLMVLLSFFVIFFSMGEAESKKVLDRVLASEKAVLQHESPTPKTARPVELKDLADLPVDQRVDRVIESDRLVLLLPDDCYAIGSLDLSIDQAPLLKEILQRLSFYKDEVDITFIGHSDTLGFSAKEKKIIRNNFDISALRATRALEKAIEMDFPRDHLKAMGDSHFGRQSRTLSLQVAVRGSK